MHESGIGPSRHFACAQQSGRFRREADITWRAGLAGSVAKDPKRSSWYGAKPKICVRLSLVVPSGETKCGKVVKAGNGSRVGTQIGLRLAKCRPLPHPLPTCKSR